MDISGKTIWQQGSGDRDRDYAHICIEWDVILNGPGYAGSWPSCTDKLLADEWSKWKMADLRRFSEKMQDGDLVVLKLGTNEVKAVGEIKGNYEFREEFGDIDGWDLQHVRRVKWIWENLKKPKKFPAYTLTQGTTHKVSNIKVTKWLEGLRIDASRQDEDCCNLPEYNHNEHSLSYDAISEYLYDKGVASQSLEALISELGELSRIANWYSKPANSDPSESETVSYLAVPLFRALGWSPQKMAIEWKNVDIALFTAVPREDDNLAVVAEAKKKGRSCMTALSQAMKYAVPRKNCNKLIVTDGIRYGVFLRESDEFKLHSYLNITRLVDYYPIYGCKGAKDALLAMTPEWSISSRAKL